MILETQGTEGAKLYGCKNNWANNWKKKIVKGH